MQSHDGFWRSSKPLSQPLILQGLPALLAEDPVAQGPVLEMLLLPHFRQLLEPDPALHPPVKLERCAAITQVQAISLLLMCVVEHSPAGSASDDPHVALPAPS